MTDAVSGETSLLDCAQLKTDATFVVICHQIWSVLLLSLYYCTVAGAVRRNRLLKKPSHSDVEAEIKVWLRQSCDANGGRRARQEKKRKKTTADDSDSDLEPID